MANANIFAQYVKPVRSVQEYAQDYDTAESNQLALGAKRMQMQQAQRGMADDEAVRGIVRQYGSDKNALAKALYGGGFVTQAQGIEKSIAEDQAAELGRRKTEGDIAKQEREAADAYYSNYETARSRFLNDPNISKQKVIGAMSEMAAFGKLPARLVEQLAASMPDDPVELRAAIERADLSRLSPEKRLELFSPKWDMKNTGQKMVPVQTNPRAPGFNADQPLTMEQTPDGKARSEDAAKARAQQERASLRADARSREATAATLTKPFEVTGPDGTPMLVQQDKQGNIRPVQGYGPKAGIEKPLNDTQSKALLFGSRMREAGKVLDELEKSGTTTSVPGSRAGYGVGSVVTALSSSQKQQLDQAKRDFVNAVLRRESGAVIADSEFDNADKQYFPQIGDSPKVIAQKRRNRELATQGILQEVPENRRNGLKPQPTLPTADDIRKQADNILKGG